MKASNKNFWSLARSYHKVDPCLSNVTLSRLNSHKSNDGQIEFSPEQVLLLNHYPKSI